MSTARIETDTHVTAPDDFLGRSFGYPCRVLALPCDPDALAAELSAMAGPAFVWTKISGPDDPQFEALAGLGFEIAVEEITYERRAGVAPAHAAPEGFSVRKILPGDADAAIAEEIGTLAATGMTTSRFHQDPRIEDGIAADIKRRWAMNFFEGARGQEMYVATDDGGRIAGFNQVLVTADCKIIDLICTHADFRRRGVARALVEAMFTPDLKTRVGSQANNETADACYRSLGFRPVGTSMCLHWHGGTP